MAILQEVHCKAPALKALDLRDGARQIVVGVDTSFEGWGVIFQQEGENKDRHLCCYESGLCNNAERQYDVGKGKCHGLLKALKKFRNYVNGIRFLLETDDNALVYQLNSPTNNLPWELVTHWIVWIQLFNINMKHVTGRLNGSPDCL